MVLRGKASPHSIGGDVDEGYGKLADAFRRNMSSGHEVGAAVAVYRDGRKVVDLWGGLRDGTTRTPWEQDTLVTVFSTTKGIASLAVAVASSRGLISYDAKVADYWPEFAQAGKEAITVRQLLSHQAGLPALRPQLTLQDLADPISRSAKLAAQPPRVDTRDETRIPRHTLGWYEGELIRRTDPAGRSIGQFFADEVAKPLNLDFYIGLPDSVDRDRVAHLVIPSRFKSMLHLYVLPPRLLAASFNPSGLTVLSLNVVKGINTPSEDFNRDELRAMEIPASNGTGDARSPARSTESGRKQSDSKSGWTQYRGLAKRFDVPH